MGEMTIRIQNIERQDLLDKTTFLKKKVISLKL